MSDIPVFVCPHTRPHHSEEDDEREHVHGRAANHARRRGGIVLAALKEILKSIFLGCFYPDRSMAVNESHEP
jgi:hypothetical protein